MDRRCRTWRRGPLDKCLDVVDRRYHPLVTEQSDRYFPLSYFFVKAAEWPTDPARLKFPTAQRMFDGHDDLETSIEPTTIRALDAKFEAYAITTYTEYFSQVFADGRWHPYYFLATDFIGFLWRERELFIGATNREVMRGFTRSTREKSGGAVFLQPLEVNLDRLAGGVTNARAITLEQTQDSGLPGTIKRLKATGRDVEEAEEVKHYRAGGGVGTGLEFDYSLPSLPPIPLAVTSDGSIRLLRHIGTWSNPNIPMELALVADCWEKMVEPVHKVRESAKRVKKPDGPGPVEGQESFDQLLES